MRHCGRTWKGDPHRLSIPRTMGSSRGEPPSAGWTVVTQAACPGVSHLDAPALAGLPITPVPHCYQHPVSTLAHKLRLSPTAHTQGVQGGISRCQASPEPRVRQE